MLFLGVMLGTCQYFLPHQCKPLGSFLASLFEGSKADPERTSLQRGRKMNRNLQFHSQALYLRGDNCSAQEVGKVFSEDVRFKLEYEGWRGIVQRQRTGAKPFQAEEIFTGKKHNHIVPSEVCFQNLLPVVNHLTLFSPLGISEILKSHRSVFAGRWQGQVRERHFSEQILIQAFDIHHLYVRESQGKVRGENALKSQYRGRVGI